MDISSGELKILLIGMNILTGEEFEQAEKNANDHHLSLFEYLPQSGLISDEHLGQLIANTYRTNYVDLGQERIPKSILELIPENVARVQQAVIFRKDEKLHLGTSRISNYEFFLMLEKRFQQPLEIYYATPLSVRKILRQYEKSYGERVEHLLLQMTTNYSDEDVVSLVSLLLSYAHMSRASDIHLEPLSAVVSVRFRVDGVLHELARYQSAIHEKIVSRIKIMSRLRTDEHAAPQDGRFSFAREVNEGGHAEEELFDVRVSILPVQHGENVVMRLLAERSQRYILAELGLADDDLARIIKAAHKPYGMILSVGPTGAGKTTSLYAVLFLLNQTAVNIMTIEDPVEYEMEHVQQTQVNEKKKLTFANGLRSIVRQDPDIIMVGEIRDDETAGIAVNAAMTGHLLLSTLHANDAATTFPRLLDMGVEPFLAASSVNVVVAQRLARRVCSKCKTNYFLSPKEIDLITAEPELAKAIRKLSGKKDLHKIRFYRGSGNGCDVCNDTGYSGRLGIFEVMEVSDALRALIAKKAPADVIEAAAVKEGMRTMFEDGIQKMLKGMTTLEEVVRAIKS